MALNIRTVFGNIFGGLSSDFKKKNFSLYGQWIALLTMLLCFALGFANLFTIHVVIVFAILCIVEGLVVIFVEIPFLLKICPLTDKFTTFISYFDENWPRCGFYLLLSVIQWLSLLSRATSLLVVAVFFALASACYCLAAIKHQEYLKSNLQVAGSEDSLEGQVGAHIVRNVL